MTLSKQARYDPITDKYLWYGNGCGIFPNCFECPESPNKCHYGNKVIGGENVPNQRIHLKPFNSYRSPESQLDK